MQSGSKEGMIVHMDDMIIKAQSRGIITRRGNVLRINNALVEEVSAGDGRNGYLIVSYAVREQNNVARIELLRLNVGNSTVITNRYGRPFRLSRIRPGMWIDTEFSAAMTRSIPPQAAAYRIVVLGSGRDLGPPSFNTITTQIVRVDTRNGLLVTGNRFDINRQIIFAVSDETLILNRNGRRISLRSLSPGQWVEITHADFMTLSIPPQTTAYRIQVL